jgi:hypothetical protein
MSEPELYRMGLDDGANDERAAIAERLTVFKASAEKQNCSPWYIAGIESCIKLITFSQHDLDSKDAE